MTKDVRPGVLCPLLIFHPNYLHISQKVVTLRRQTKLFTRMEQLIQTK